ncbi:MAG: D-alanyl-D-alanine carboxypeptidase [Desulfovibrio sp.]|jgi:D-alanyl-D-alanine carboxypeptidase (penicillin-binding protein 5/6)|nr:D-alanyl-D-alanine carboxypeptidase [Desulfovibrio sp.]
MLCFQTPRVLALLFSLCLFPVCTATAFPAKSGLVLNMRNGRVLYAHKADLSLPPASLTKIMTLFLALDAVRAKQISLNTLVKIGKNASNVGGSSMHLKAGERVPLHSLLAGMAVASGNDAATAVAQRLANGSTKNFVKRMNRKISALGLRRTQFRNPTGLPDPGQKSTAREMALLARAYLRAHPRARDMHALPSVSHNGRALYNTNGLLGQQGIDGLKTGFTSAGYNIVITAGRDKTRLLAVVMGAASRAARDAAVEELLARGFGVRK